MCGQRNSRSVMAQANTNTATDATAIHHCLCDLVMRSALLTFTRLREIVMWCVEPIALAHLEQVRTTENKQSSEVDRPGFDQSRNRAWRRNSRRARSTRASRGPNRG